MGVYLLCEQNQAADGRVSVHEPKKGETGREIGYLLELDNYPSDEHPYIWIGEFPEVEDIAGEKRAIRGRCYSIKSDITAPRQKQWIQRWMNGTFTILYEAAVNERPMRHGLNGQAVYAEGMHLTPYEAVNRVIDVDSLVDMVILEELVHNYDVGEGSFYMAIDFSEGSAYPRLTFLAPWDFNWAYDGAADGGYYAVTFQPEAADSDRSNGWMILAMKAPWFRDLVRKRWRELRESGVLERAVSEVVDECGSLANDLGPDQNWRIYCAMDIAAFVRGRMEWLDSQWLTDDE
jgi:hypothetical protein